MPFNSYAEYAEDFWIVKNLPIPEKGFFLDIGCGDPVNNSTTAFLREAGWDGIGVDGNPAYVHRWNEVGGKFISAVLATRDGSAGFALNATNPSLSRLDDAAPGTRCRTIENLLSERLFIGKIDFLAIDVEGAEFDVLSLMDFGKHAPSIIVSEYSTMQPDGSVKEDFRVKEMLEKIGYKTVHRTTANMIYARA